MCYNSVRKNNENKMAQHFTQIKMFKSMCGMMRNWKISMEFRQVLGIEDMITVLQDIRLIWKDKNNLLKRCEWVSEYCLMSPSMLLHRSFPRQVFPVYHLHWYWQLNQNNQEKHKIARHKVAIVKNTNRLRKNYGKTGQKTDQGLWCL